MFKKIQEKPEHVKKRISLILTIIIFGVIVFVWVSSRTARMVAPESRARSASPIESFKEIFNGGISDIRNTIMRAEFFGGKHEEPTPVDIAPLVEEKPTSATSTPRFDMSGVIIIDRATSTRNAR